MYAPSLLSLCLALATAVGGAHAFHVSRLTVNANPREGRLELVLNTFVDDLEHAIALEHALETRSRTDARLPAPADVNLLGPRQHAATDSLARVYLGRHLRLRGRGGRPLPLEVLGLERADDPYGMFVYLTVAVPASEFDDLTLESTFLTAAFADQQNVVVWQRDGASAGYSLLTADRRTSRPSE